MVSTNEFELKTAIFTLTARKNVSATFEENSSNDIALQVIITNYLDLTLWYRFSAGVNQHHSLRPMGQGLLIPAEDLASTLPILSLFLSQISLALIILNTHFDVFFQLCSYSSQFYQLTRSF